MGCSGRSAPESFRVFYRIWGEDDVKAYSLAIPSHILKPFSDVDVLSNLPEHDCLHLSRSGDISSRDIYPDYLSSIRARPGFMVGLPLSNTAVVGSTLYALFFGGKGSGGKLKSLNLDSPHPQSWKQLPSPPFLGPGVLEIKPKLVSLRGCLYLFCKAKPFGQIYNPNSNSWSVLHEPSEIADSSKCNMWLRTSLGESHGKILVYGEDVVTDYKSTRFHVYDIDSHQWTTSSSTFQLDVAPLADPSMLGKAVVKKDDDTSTFFYFMGTDGLVYAFDWLNKELFHGPIVGLEREDLINRLNSSNTFYTFFHIWGDLFCFLWSTHTHPEEVDQYSYHHFTFLRLVKDSKPGDGSLTAYVVGCLQDTVDDFYQCFDALLV